MTLIRLGYVAMSMIVKNASPSQTMTFAQFQKLADREAALRRLERIALSNIHHTLRLLRHNAASEIHFYRLTSRIIPLANHEELLDWNYIKPLKKDLAILGDYIKEQNMRVDFHPDHFVVLNSTKEAVFKNSVATLKLHLQLLKEMGLDWTHRCVMHVGGNYKETDRSLERFVDNWMLVPSPIQKMIMLENDDTSFDLEDTLYLCEKLGIPLVFDYHHHLAYHKDADWRKSWERIMNTWRDSPWPMKMHISSPKDEKNFRHHADYVDISMFLDFLNEVKGTVPQIDCMIEAKQKDKALFQLMDEIKKLEKVDIIDNGSFVIR